MTNNEREVEIRERRAHIANSPWGSSRDLDGRYTVQAGTYLTLTDGFASTGTVAHIDGSSEEERYHRADFIARAPGDIDTLLAEIDRLRDELAAASAQDGAR